MEFFSDSTILFLWISTEKSSSSITDPNDSQGESENNFLASYMMEVQDNNVYIGRMTTDVSGDSGLDGQSEENSTVSPRWMCYFGNIMSYKLRF